MRPGPRGGAGSGVGEIRGIQAAARGAAPERPRWPMIVLRSPKGWTGPKEVDGGRSRALPRPPGPRTSRPTPDHRRSRGGCAPTGPRSSSTPTAGRRTILAACPRGRPPDGREPARQRRLLLAGPARLPDFRGSPSRSSAGDRARRRRPRGTAASCATSTANPDARTSASSVLTDGLEPLGTVRGRPTAPGTPRSPPERRPPGARRPGMEILSEHTCQGWLQGYLLTGRHGLFSCYEAFVDIVDSMSNQYAKWLKTAARDAVAPAGRLAQLPADVGHLAAGSQRLLATRTRLHRPRGEQEATSCASICRRTQTRCCRRPTTACGEQLHQRGRGGKQPAPQWLTWTRRSRTAAGHRHLEVGGQRRRAEPDVVIGGAGDVPTWRRWRRSTAARQLPGPDDPVVNVVDLMRLQPSTRAPARPGDREFDACSRRTSR